MTKLPLSLRIRYLWFEARTRGRYNKPRLKLYLLGVVLGSILGYAAAWTFITGDLWWFPWENWKVTVEKP